MQNNNERLKMLILSALFAAITAVLAQLSVKIPFSPVPFTGQTLAVGLAATILGSRYGTISMAVYLAVGAIGLPVFASMNGGFHVIVGPTGGFIIGFIATAFITGYILEKTSFSYVMAIIANIIGMFVTLAFGVTQLKFVADLSWSAAIAAGATPFLFFGVVKAVMAAYIGVLVRKRLVSAKLLPSPTTKSTSAA